MDKIEQLDRILIDYNLGNIKRHKAREKICLLFDVVGRSEQLARKSCHHACSPSDFYKGGKCDKMGCYEG
jgi:hypothetical protein